MKIKLLVTSVLTLIAAHQASAIGFIFQQSGFGFGGTVSGSFFGEDLNNDGYISGSSGGYSEIAAFFLQLTGNSVVPDFWIDSNVPASGTWSLVYKLGAEGGFVGDDAGEFTVDISNGGGFQAGAAGGALYYYNQNGDDYTSDLMLVAPVSQVPDSGATAALLLVGLMAVIGIKRRLA